MRGWFDFPPGMVNLPSCREIEAKRLKGFEPSTFCMAIRPVTETNGQRT
jgi:hypothetical protein